VAHSLHHLREQERLEVSPVADAFRSIANNLSEVSRLLGGLETGIRSDLEIAVASRVANLLSMDPTVGSQSAQELLRSFRAEADRILVDTVSLDNKRSGVCSDTLCASVGIDWMMPNRLCPCSSRHLRNLGLLTRCSPVGSPIPHQQPTQSYGGPTTASALRALLRQGGGGFLCIWTLNYCKISASHQQGKQSGRRRGCEFLPSGSACRCRMGRQRR
jgi:hypothetical protein